MREYKNDELIEIFLSKLYADNSSDHTITNYKIDLNFFVEYLNSKDLSITDVRLKHLESYKTHLRDVRYGDNKQYSEGTRARRVSCLKSFYKYLYDREIIERNPARNLTVPKVERGMAPVFMTQEDAQLLLNMTKDETHELRDKTIIMLFLTTGMRLSELSNLDINDITGTQITIRKGKGNKTRVVNISKDVADLVKEYIDKRKYMSDKALFTSQQGNRMRNRTIQWTIDKYIKKAGLDERLSTHKIRHTSAVLMLQNKVDLNTIREVFGHTSLRTTQIYIHTLDETKQETADLMGNLFN